ncbi:hypothetical protein POVCU2_0033320 [Plasmodium ovale curtisi]|uniref:Uncharacterized protein n=1 Tax=Plasmodium ovale curtisi TaxID=864141 RepID=A0A1A8W3P5_PLAOA|nr:hypothetical protein POVCU2_0033320 [Plasmodium ovale curtisi]
MKTFGGTRRGEKCGETQMRRCTTFESFATFATFDAFDYFEQFLHSFVTVSSQFRHSFVTVSSQFRQFWHSFIKTLSTVIGPRNLTNCRATAIPRGGKCSWEHGCTF